MTLLDTFWTVFLTDGDNDHVKTVCGNNSNNNNNNNNNNNQQQCLRCCPHDHGHCESSPGSFHECRLSARWPPTLRPSQPTWPVSLPVSSYYPHQPLPFIISTQPKNRHSFYHPMEGGRLSQSEDFVRVCSPYPSVHHSGCQWPPARRFKRGISHTRVRHVTTRSLRPTNQIGFLRELQSNHCTLLKLDILHVGDPS